MHRSQRLLGKTMSLASNRMTTHKNLEEFREWSAKFRHWMVDIAESDTHDVWICVDHLRSFHPDMPKNKDLTVTYQHSMFYVKDGGRLFIAESGLSSLIKATANSHQHVDALRFLDWFDRNVAQVAAKKRIEHDRRESIANHEALEGSASGGTLAIDQADPPWASTLPPNSAGVALPQAGNVQPTLATPTPEEIPLVRLSPREWLASQYNDLQNSTASFWHGERNIVLTFVMGLLIGYMPMYLWESILSDDGDWAESYLSVMWWNLAALMLALSCAFWFGVTMTRSLKTSFQKPGSVIWTLPFYLFTFSTIFSIGMQTWSLSLLEEGWDTMLGRPRPAEVYADPYLGRIVVKGPLKFGSSIEVERVLNANRKLTLVEIESPGGYVVEGLRMAKLIADRKLDTVSFDHCESACTLILASGADRYLGPTVEVGFHRSGTKYGPVDSAWSAIDHQMARLLRSRGVSERFIHTAFIPSIRDIWYAPHEDMYAAGYATSKWSDRKSGY